MKILLYVVHNYTLINFKKHNNIPMYIAFLFPREATEEDLTVDPLLSYRGKEISNLQTGKPSEPNHC